MQNLSSRLAATLSLAALAAATAAAWFSWQTREDMRGLAALTVRPALVMQGDFRPGAGLHISNQGVGPGVISAVRMALPAADGTLDWLAYPDTGNAPAMDFWAFLGLGDVNAGLPAGVAALAQPPQPGAVFPVGQGADLIRFPAGAAIPEAWKAQNMARADAVLQGLMFCIDYQGMDGSRYQLDRGGLCARAMADTDRRYTGK